MSLQIEYRPKSFKTFAGNDAIKQSLTELLQRDKPPAAFLLTGPSGNGKTSLGRIIAHMLGCHKNEIRELNTASDRTLPAIRLILDDMKYTPLSGKKKVILFDECFSKETKILLSSGVEIPIENIKTGDSIQNLNGNDIVKNTFINKVNLDRVVKVTKSNGKITFCSCDHLFYINEKWVEARYLTNQNLLCYDTDIMSNTDYKKEVQNEKLSNVQQIIYSKKEKNNLLLKRMCRTISSKREQFKKSKNNNSRKDLRILSETFYPQSKIQRSSILFKKLLKFMGNTATGISGKSLYRRIKKENWTESESLQFYRRWKTLTKKIIRTNDFKQSFKNAGSYRKRKDNQTVKWDFKHFFRNSWWKWNINGTPNFAYEFIGMETRNSNSDSRSFTTWFTRNLVQEEKSPSFIQSRCGESGIEDSNRDRWKGTFINKKSNRRQKERITPTVERVESVEIYQRGSNDESFKSIIGNKERDQGYVLFYDLEITKNHSYIANGNMVHNCHQLLAATQEALLKALEEPPEHVHFVMCTTNPEALKTTFKRRCHIYELSPLTSSQLMIHLKKILSAEKVEGYPTTILDKIIELSDGSAGIALKYLDMVIDMKNDIDRAMETLKSSGTSETEIIDICRTLMNFQISNLSRWTRVKHLLSNFKGDAESARRPILGYFEKCLLGKSSNEIEIILMADEFKDNFYDNGKYGLTAACFKACYSPEEK